MIIASVIIPCKDRQTLMERAVKSIVELDKNKVVEIIVVDDGSDEPLYRPDVMREWDRIITLSENRGGAVTRNIGIDNALGQIIYLLDSDDYFISRDFEFDFKNTKVDCLYYGDVILNDIKSSYPENISINNYFEYIFHKYPYITQTSTLLFHKNTYIRFDENLPKHQDWDLVLYSLKKGIKLEKYKSLTFIDTFDKKSVSRLSSVEKSMQWQNKIFLDETIDYLDKFYVCLNTNFKTDSFGFIEFIKNLLILFEENKISKKILVLAFLRRYKLTTFIYLFFKKFFRK